MIENRPDWCVSRQRFWGVPMPLFIHKKTDELHPKTKEFLDDAASIIEKDGIEGWFDYDKKKLLGSDINLYKEVTDTLDVWFDSGVTHLCVMQERGLGQVADLYLEGSDQHRGWFQSSLITALATIGKPPYKSVLTHGFVVDSEGQKMSKSLGNIISPQEIIQDKGSDILRLWVATTDYSKEMNISEDIIKQTTESYRRLRNTARFLLSNTDDFDLSTEQVNYEKMPLLDKWILHRAQVMQEKIKNNYELYKFHQIAQDIQNFCTVDLGGFYLDVIKDRLYTTQKNSLARKSCQTTCYRLLNMLNIWIAPILSFTAEEIHLQKKNIECKSIFLEKWKDTGFQLTEDDINTCNLLFELRNDVLKELEVLRKSGEIGSSLDATLEIKADTNLLARLKSYSSELKFIFITSDCILSDLPANQNSKKILDYNYLITVNKSSNSKCERCWHRNESVGSSNKHPSLCSRCCDNIEGKGEIRQLG
jgi:isoleucyl-tRNA synthetase